MRNLSRPLGLFSDGYWVTDNNKIFVSYVEAGCFGPKKISIELQVKCVKYYLLHQVQVGI